MCLTMKFLSKEPSRLRFTWFQSISENVNNALKDDRHCKHKLDKEQLGRIQVDTQGFTCIS